MSFRNYPVYKDSAITWIGSVPSEWQVRKIGHSFGSVGSGTTPPTSDEKWFSQGEIPWVTTGELRENIVKKTKKYLIPEALEAFSALQIHPKGALVIAMYGATIGRLGVLGIPATTNQACCALSQPKSLDIRFTFYWLLVHREPIVSLFSSGGGQPNINRETVMSLRVPAPKLEEQVQITRFLDHETAKIDTLIHEQKRLIELLQEKRQAVISHAVTKGLDPNVPMKDSGVEWLGEVPAHWEVVPAKFLYDFVTSGSRGWAEYYSDSGELFFRITNLTRDSIRPKLDSIKYVSPPEGSEGSRAKIKIGDVLISITADLGSVCAANKDIEGGYVSQHVALARTNTKVRCSEWLAYFILGDAAKEQLLGAGYGGTKIQLSLEDIRSFIVVMPPQDEQISISQNLTHRLSDMATLINEAVQTVKLLRERRSALISAAVTGKIDVRNWQPPADESAFDEEVRQAGMEATV